MYKLRIFEFLFFKISQIGLFWSKIIIFIIEISLKLHLHTKYGWNNPNWRWLGLKSPKFNLLPFLAAQKFIPHTNIRIHVTSSIFIVTWFFLNARNNDRTRINNNLNYQKMPITGSTIPLCGWYGVSCTHGNCSSATLGDMSRICWTSWHCIQHNENSMYAGPTKAFAWVGTQQESGSEMSNLALSRSFVT